jgi:hypothetical protein
LAAKLKIINARNLRDIFLLLIETLVLKFELLERNPMKFVKSKINEKGKNWL